MTGRRAAQGHEDPPGGSAPAPPAQPGPPAQAGPTTQAGPLTQPGPPTQAGPTTQPGPPALPGQAVGPDQPVEVEPTTGAPVDAVPRRVPVRQPGGRLRRAPAPDEDAPDDDGLFWAPIEQVHWDGTPLREEHGRRRWSWRRAADADSRDGTRRRRTADRRTHPPDPWQGLSALLALSLLAAFFAWVSAGPFWLALGHATTGTVVIGECTGTGLTQRCRGVFTAEGERFIAFGVRVSGVPAERTAAGSTLTARMTGPSGDTAYADTGAGRHLRWLLGLLLVLACGVGIARYTGAARLADRRARRWAVAVAVAGPLVISAGFLAAAW
ncbi:hypothetical protein [Micromonospora haikouensis]|uniref:hypothetical protein n=1 Tax=Micromonospora haikouensis TaxID=686309 RepID=UPI003D759081